MAKSTEVEKTEKVQNESKKPVAKTATKKASTKSKVEKTATTKTTKKVMATSEKIRIRLKAYDHVLIDQSAEKIVDLLKEQELKFQVLFRYQLKRK